MPGNNLKLDFSFILKNTYKYKQRKRDTWHYTSIHTQQLNCESLPPFLSPLLLLSCSLTPSLLCPRLSCPAVSSGLPCRSRSPLFCFSDFCNSVHSPLPE